MIFYMEMHFTNSYFSFILLHLTMDFKYLLMILFFMGLTSIVVYDLNEL
jgi:hypothetical protein